MGTANGGVRSMNAEPIAQELLIAIANSKSYPYLIEATNGAVLLDDGKAGFTPPRELRSLMIAPNGAEQYAGARGQDVIGALMPVVLNNGMDVTGWAVVVEQPSSDAFTSVRNSALLLGMLVILVGALALLIAFRQAQQFLGPLKALRTGALALGTGQLSYRIEPLGDDEMGDLAQQFVALDDVQADAVRPKDESRPEKFDGKILVPFPIESALSGVMAKVGDANRLWYHTSFEWPAAWKSQRALLHLGAVDWDATVLVNGKQVGQHRGGYTPIDLDITDAVNPTGPQELVVSVWDPTDAGAQPRGKQVARPNGIWYTAVTGIWQTVWIEPFPFCSASF
jgi:hypothetical protein